MKQRFSSLDINVIASELSSTLVGLRLANVYDISSRIFLFRFQQPGRKEQLIVESGFRCHLTYFNREIAAAPSPFTARIRKCLRSRRLTAVRQIGTDRVLELVFSDGQFRLLLEFFAGGNVIITDNNYDTLFLLRDVHEGPELERLRPGLKYNLSIRQNYDGIPPLTRERVQHGLQEWLEKQQSSEVTQSKKRKNKQTDQLRRALATSLPEFPPLLLDHSFSTQGFDAATKIEDVLQSETLLLSLMNVLEEALSIFNKLIAKKSVKGYILARKRFSNGAGKAVEGDLKETADPLLYEQFHPFKARQFEDLADTLLLEYEGFNKTVDEFFSSLEGQKLQSRLQEREQTAKRRLDQARDEHTKRIGGLQQAQALHVRKAQAIEANIERVEEAIAAVNGLVGQGMDWTEIARLIELEQKRGNPVAELFKLPLKLYENTVTLRLAEPGLDEFDQDFEGSETESEDSANEKDGSKQEDAKQKEADRTLSIDIDLGISSWSNATLYYEQKKEATAKERKTLLASDKALKNAKHKITTDLKKGLKQEKDILRPVRNPFWFEKFYYFISSDGYLVLGGKDAQQSDMLYMRHLRKGDVYVHADINNATPVLVKNSSSAPDSPIPPSTLTQAGSLVVSTSTAWQSKALMSAWWVSASQVSKVSSSGDYLEPGSFQIGGKKNYLPPAPLLIGLAAVFQISESSKLRHTKYRIEEETVLGETEVGKSTILDDKSMIASEGDFEGDQQKDISDSDEDFPDVDLQSHSDRSDGEDNEESPNPLISFKGEHSKPQELNIRMSSSGALGNGHPLEQYNPAIELKERQKADSAEDLSAASNEVQPSNTGEPQPSPIQQVIEENTPEWGRSQDKNIADDEVVGTDSIPTDNESQVPGHEGTNAMTISPLQTQPKLSQLPRGKRGKQKKAATKYAHQDESDRELALSLLGHHKGESKKPSSQESEAAKTAELMEQKQRRREQHHRAQLEGKKKEEERRAKMESNVEDPENGSTFDSVDLDALVGTPLPGDEIVAALPVCAPWAALSKCKYKIKMQPGLLKKGKAIREILGKWETDYKDKKKVDPTSTDTEKIWPNEIEQMRAWKDTEVIGMVPVGKVRVIAPATKNASGQQQNKGKSSRGGRGSKKQR